MADIPPSPANSDGILIEIAVESVKDAVVAHRGGADRLELSADLHVDGLTPPPDVLSRIRQTVPLPVAAMVRPRSGSFCYDAVEWMAMHADAEKMLDHGAGGVVFGCLRHDRTIDLAACERLLGLCCNGAEAVFHRAFDLTPDPFRALEQLIELGFTRVLTAGGARGGACDNADMLAGLIRQAAGRIEILPAGGIRSTNAVELIQTTGCRQIHSSCRVAAKEPVLSSDESFTPRGTDAGLVAALRRCVDAMA